MRRPLSGEGLMSTGFGDLKVFSGSAHPQLTKEIADFLGIAAGQARLRRFPDSEVSFQIDENIRGTDVFIVQPTSNPVDAASDGAADHDRRVPPFVGGAHHGGDSVLRLRAAGPQGQAARADLGQARGEPAERGRHATAC